MDSYYSRAVIFLFRLATYEFSSIIVSSFWLRRRFCWLLSLIASCWVEFSVVILLFEFLTSSSNLSFSNNKLLFFFVIAANSDLVSCLHISIYSIYFFRFLSYFSIFAFSDLTLSTSMVRELFLMSICLLFLSRFSCDSFNWFFSYLIIFSLESSSSWVLW